MKQAIKWDTQEKLSRSTTRPTTRTHLDFLGSEGRVVRAESEKVGGCNVKNPAGIFRKAE